VPLLNPLYSKKCPIDAICEPYVNPPPSCGPQGEFGNAPRTGTAYATMKEYLDLSVQKNIYRGTREGRRITLKLDAINVSTTQSRVQRFGAERGRARLAHPVETPVTAAEYNCGRLATIARCRVPQRRAVMKQIQDIVTTMPANSTILPKDFFSIPLPQGFSGMDPLASTSRP